MNQELIEKWGKIVSSAKKVEVSWDAGGDETPVWIDVDGERVAWKESQGIVDVIIENLQLPNAGEEYSEGGGVLLFDGETLSLRYKTRVTGPTWDHIDTEAEGFDPETFDWDANSGFRDEEVSDEVELY